MVTMVDGTPDSPCVCLRVGWRRLDTNNVPAAVAKRTDQAPKDVCPRAGLHETPSLLFSVSNRFANLLVRVFCHCGGFR